MVRSTANEHLSHATQASGDFIRLLVRSRKSLHEPLDLTFAVEMQFVASMTQAPGPERSEKAVLKCSHSSGNADALPKTLDMVPSSLGALCESQLFEFRNRGAQRTVVAVRQMINKMTRNEGPNLSE